MYFEPAGARIYFRSLYNQFSPCSRANGDVGNLTLKYNIKLDASKSSGYASLESGRRVDLKTGEDIDDALTLGIKWLIQPCS